MAAPTPGNQTESYPQGVQEVFDFAGMIDRTSPAEHQRELDQLVLDEVGKFESGEARLVALEGLYQQAYDQEPFARAINTERDRKYGDKLLDVSFE